MLQTIFQIWRPKTTMHDQLCRDGRPDSVLVLIRALHTGMLRYSIQVVSNFERHVHMWPTTRRDMTDSTVSSPLLATTTPPRQPPPQPPLRRRRRFHSPLIQHSPSLLLPSSVQLVSPPQRSCSRRSISKSRHLRVKSCYPSDC